MVDLVGAANLHDSSLVNDGDRVAHREALPPGHSVTKTKVNPQRSLEVLELDLHLVAQLCIERGKRLIEE
jgi:hypothetical protein